MTWLLVLGSCYLGICALLFFFQERLIFVPFAELQPVAIEHRDLWLRTADGTRIHAWLVPRAESRGVVLFCHGNAGNLSHRADSLALFRDLGFEVLIFDYPGYGRSDGRPGEAGITAAGRAACEWLLSEGGHRPNELVIFGRSLGGAVAMRLCDELLRSGRRPRALIVESSFPELAAAAGSRFWWLPVRWLLRHPFDSRGFLDRIDVPTLVVHSKGDEIVPYAGGERIYASLPGPKRFLEIRGSHNAGWIESLAEYRAGLERFLDELPR